MKLTTPLTFSIELRDSGGICLEIPARCTAEDLLNKDSDFHERILPSLLHALQDAVRRRLTQPSEIVADSTEPPKL